jgi:hypothetical protein
MAPKFSFSSSSSFFFFLLLPSYSSSSSSFFFFFFFFSIALQSDADLCLLHGLQHILDLEFTCAV